MRWIRHQLGLDSYDRFFPYEDTMPKGGLGNLIALPLQKLPRADGNSVFVDAEFRPYSDQWAFLASVKRMPVCAAEAVVLEAQRRGDLVGVKSALRKMRDKTLGHCHHPKASRAPNTRPLSGAGPSCSRQPLVYRKEGSSFRDAGTGCFALGIQNPEFYKAQAMRLPTFNKPRVIACGEELADHIALPRGCLAEVIELLKSHRIKPMVRDERSVGRPIEVAFSGRLRPLQQDAVDAFAQHDEGILCAPTAFGKAAVAAWLIASRKVNTLILVHRQQLLDQWHARLAMFLGLPAKSIGQIGGGVAKRSGCVDIAILQSAHDKEGVKDFVAEYGQVIVDECHHLSAFTFEQVMRQVRRNTSSD